MLPILYSRINILGGIGMNLLLGTGQIFWLTAAPTSLYVLLHLDIAASNIIIGCSKTKERDRILFI